MGECPRIFVAGRSLEVILDSWDIAGTHSQYDKIYLHFTREGRYESTTKEKKETEHYTLGIRDACVVQ